MDIAQLPVEHEGPGKLVLLWAGAIGVALSLYVFAGYIWASVITAVLLAVMCWLTWRNIGSTPPPVLTEAGQAHSGGGLCQKDIEAIVPAFEYHRQKEDVAAAEQCAVCISAVRGDETVRRLPACGHVFHASCVDGWVRVHATCPMCRAEINGSAGETPAEQLV